MSQGVYWRWRSSQWTTRVQRTVYRATRGANGSKESRVGPDVAETKTVADHWWTAPGKARWWGDLAGREFKVGKGAEDEVVDDGREVRDNDSFCWREKTEESRGRRWRKSSSGRGSGARKGRTKGSQRGWRRRRRGGQRSLLCRPDRSIARQDHARTDGKWRSFNYRSDLPGSKIPKFITTLIMDTDLNLPENLQVGFVF